MNLHNNLCLLSTDQKRPTQSVQDTSTDRSEARSGWSMVRRFLFSDDGTTATEYAVMLGLILLLVILGVSSVGGGVSGWWNNIDSDLNTHGF